MTVSRPKILAIDDTPANLMTLGAALEGEFELQFATSGPDGIALALEAPPDLILLDVMMPEVDGFETYRRLSALVALKEIPVVFITALDNFDSEVHGLTLGAADYITKPIHVNVARQRIRNLLERELWRKEVTLQRDSLRKLSVAVEQSPVSVAITGLDACLEYVNPRFTEITGYSEAEVLGKNPRMFQSGLTNHKTHLDLWDKLTHGQIWTGEFINRHKNGEVYWAGSQIAPVKDSAGLVTHYVALCSDISDRKAMEQKIRQLAFYDALTGLPNRRLLADRLSQGLATSKRSGCCGALMFLDLDNFKPLNDAHGHGVGDSLLIEVARRLTACVREVDTVARFGGDEFVVLLGELDTSLCEPMEQAHSVAEKIRASLATPYSLRVDRQDESPVVLVEHRCSASIGVVVFLGNEARQDEVLKWADAAMYQAKDAGRNSIRFYKELPA